MFKPITLFCLITMLISSTLASDLTDPMAPFSAAASGPGGATSNNDLVLSAIIIGKHRRVAIINDQPYQLGYPIKDYELTAIEPHSVQITRDGTNRTLVLGAPPLESIDNAD